MADKPQCMTEGCDKPVKRRGLCNACYGAALREVKSGVITWAWLEERGFILPPRNVGRKPGPFLLAIRKARAEENEPELKE